MSTIGAIYRHFANVHNKAFGQNIDRFDKIVSLLNEQATGLDA